MKVKVSEFLKMAQLEDMFIIVMKKNGNGELLDMFQRKK